MRVALAGVCCALLAAGCGTAHESAPGESQTQTAGAEKTRPLIEFQTGTSSSLMWYVEEEAHRKPRRVEDVYGVFGRAQTRDEAELEPHASIEWSCSSPSEGEDSFDAGKPIAGGTRILLHDVGPQQYELVATPTTRNAVGYGLFPEGSGSCGVPSSEGFELAAQVDRSAIVYGLVEDGVASIELVVEGTKHRARLGENGFALVIPEPAGSSLDKVVLHRSDGSSTEIP